MKTLFLLFCLCMVRFVHAQSSRDTLVDQWHKAASKADFKNYFDIMTNDFVFLGTAPGERWTKSEFAAFSKPYFEQGKAWDFIPSNRKWVLSKDERIAWFDEDLDTWMRGCRGSGILVKNHGKWKIAYYNLTVLIENEKMKQFIELRDKPISE